MARLFFAIALFFTALVALAFATEDSCDGLTPGRLLATVAAAISVGALVGTVLPRRFARRLNPWVVGAATIAIVLPVTWVLLTLDWVEKCSA